MHAQVEYIEREIRPQDVRERSGGFTSALRRRLFALLGGRTDDEAGHLIANTVCLSDQFIVYTSYFQLIIDLSSPRWINL